MARKVCRRLEIRGNRIMKTWIFSALVATLTVFANPIYAHSDPLKGGTCWGIAGTTLTPTLTFNCQHLGTVTIGQIYEKGFRVVSSITHAGFNGAISLIIEEQKP